MKGERMRRLIQGGLSVAVLLLLSTAASATPFYIGTLDQVNNPAPGMQYSCGPGCVVIGDKEFSSLFVGAGLTPVQINGQIDPDGTISIGFSIPAVVGSSQVLDFTISYTVTSLAGATISSIDQYVSGGFTTPGGGQFHVTEVATAADGTTALSTVSADTNNIPGWDFSDPPAELFDVLNIIPNQTTLSVLKDVYLQGYEGGGASVTTIRQSFHQNQVPEPATATLMGIGLAGLWFVGRRRKA
jgi:hypothetical protein